MALFELAIAVVLKHEGGYVNDPADPGGETRFGISKRSYPGEDIKNLTEARAREIYRRDWWDRNSYWRVDDQAIATKVFDLAVNMGTSQAHKLLQRAVRAQGRAIKEDGVLGPVTLSAVNEMPPGPLLAALRSEAAGFYRTLAAVDAKRSRFIDGWLTRAYA